MKRNQMEEFKLVYKRYKKYYKKSLNDYKIQQNDKYINSIPNKLEAM